MILCLDESAQMLNVYANASGFESNTYSVLDAGLPCEKSRIVRLTVNNS